MVKFFQTKAIFAVLFVFLFHFGWTQNPKADQLEQLYDQGHYGMVWRKANRWSQDARFASPLIEYYKSLAWLQRGLKSAYKNQTVQAVEEPFKVLLSLLGSSQGQSLLVAHREEVLLCTNRLKAALEEGAFAGNSPLQSLIESYQTKVLSLVQANGKTAGKTKEGSQKSWTPSKDPALTSHVNLISFAFTLENIPYKYGGTTPDGFDCSGFTSYVFLKASNKKLPRRSIDQFNQSTRIERADAQIGDLVFFGTEGVVSHVGILINERGKPLQMIHASSSRGITTDWIEDSDYFRPRLMGFGRY